MAGENSNISETNSRPRAVGTDPTTEAAIETRTPAEIKASKQLEASQAYQPSAAPDAAQVANWSASTKLKQKNGKTKLTGSAAAASHPLAQLLGQLKIAPQDLSPKVASVLQDAMTQNLSLHDSASWTQLAQSLLLAHLQDTNAVPKEAVPAQSELPPASSPESAVTRNPELAATAPLAAAPTNGVLAARVKSLSEQNGQAVSRKEALRSLSTALIKDLELPSSKRSVITTLLGGTLKAATKKAGRIDAAALASVSFAELAELEAQSGPPGSYAMASSLMSLIESEAVKQGEAISPELTNLTANLAAFGLRALIAQKLGKESGLNSDEVLAQMQAAVGTLTGASVDAENVELSESAKAAKAATGTQTQNVETAAETSKTGGANQVASASITPEIRATAQHVMEALSINSRDKSNVGIRAAYEQILATSKGEPEALYLAASQWLDARIGTNRAVHDQKMLKEGVPPGMLQSMINDRFLAIAAFTQNPKEMKRKFLMNEQLAGKGANAGLAANGLGGEGGFRFGAPNGFGTGGLLGPGSPMDADGSKNHIYAQRSLQINAILNDPSLSIEDKIFYFMMWFAAYADKEREQKMREIADLDNQSQENNLKKQELSRNRQALYQSRKAMQQTVQSAEQKLRRASPKHEQIHDVQKAIAKVTASESPDAGKLEGLQKKLEGLQKHDRGGNEALAGAKKVLDEAKSKLMQVQVKIEGHSKQIDELQSNSDSGTKSRELLFMELERIQRFRGMLIDMANSFMRDMSRRVKEIMQ